MYSESDEKDSKDRKAMTHASSSVTNTSDQHSSNTCSRTDILFCGITSHTTPTLTSTILKNIEEPSLGLSPIELLLEHQHQARFVPPTVSFSGLSTQSSHKVDDSRHSSDETLDSQQSSETPVTSGSFRTGKSDLLRDENCSGTDGLSCGLTTYTTPTITSATLRNIEDPFIGLSNIETPLENPHQARFVPPAVQFSYFPKQGTCKVDTCSYPSEKTFISHQQPHSESSDVPPSSSKTYESDNNYSLKNEKGSIADCLTRDNTSLRTSTLTSSTLKNVEDRKDDQMYPSDHSLDSSLSPPKLTIVSETSKMDKSRCK